MFTKESKKNKLLILFFVLFIGIHIQAQVDLTKYLPQNYVKNGSVDYTNYLQIGVDMNSYILMPNFPILINKNGLQLHSNQTIVFQENSSLIMEPNEEANYGMLNIIDVENIKIINPILKGDRDHHLGSEGEWGMGLNILSSKNVKVINSNISNLWGDAVYVGEIPYKERAKYNRLDFFCENVIIDGGVIENNRRNGISVISVKELLIQNILIRNTNGTLPMAGIDLEPNNNEQFLENIIIKNVTTQNNGEVGIKYVPSRFFGSRKKNVSILIDDCKDYGSKAALVFGGALPDKSYKNQPTKVKGHVKVVNFHSFDNEHPIKMGTIQKYNPDIMFESFKVFKSNERNKNTENSLIREFKSRARFY